MAIARFHRFFAALLVLAYLLVGSGLARAVVWCVDESGHSHVEFNPAGDCQVACESSGDQAAPSALPGLNSNSPEQSCQDIGLLTIQAKNSRVNPGPTALLAALEPPMPSATMLADTLRHTSKPCLTPLPPTTALAALKTVVLLT